MCGRFALHSSKDQIKRQFNAQVPAAFEPRYNIGPGQKILALIGLTLRNLRSDAKIKLNYHDREYMELRLLQKQLLEFHEEPSLHQL